MSCLSWIAIGKLCWKVRGRKMKRFLEANVYEWHPQHFYARFHHHHRWNTISFRVSTRHVSENKKIPKQHWSNSAMKSWNRWSDSLLYIRLTIFLVTACNGMNSNPLPPWFASSDECPIGLPGPLIFSATVFSIQTLPSPQLRYEGVQGPANGWHTIIWPLNPFYPHRSDVLRCQLVVWQPLSPPQPGRRSSSRRPHPCPLLPRRAS